MPSLFKRALLRSWPVVRAVVPRRHRMYRFEGGKIFLDIAESPMMLARALGIYEVDKTAALKHLLRPGGVFVDVGANKGDFALIAAKLVGASGRVFTFEPEPRNCDWIRRSIDANGYSWIELFPIALGEAEGAIDLHVSHISGHHSVVSGRGDHTGDVIRVPMRTLDAVMADAGSPRVDVLKIDVEGADLAVLRGARRTLAAHRELVILLDVHPHLGVDALEVCRLLRDQGFTLCDPRTPFDVPLEPRSDLLELLARRPSA